MDWETLVGCSSRTCIWCFGSKRDQQLYVSFSETFRFGFILSISYFFFYSRCRTPHWRSLLNPSPQASQNHSPERAGPVFYDRLRTIHILPKWIRRMMWLVVCVFLICRVWRLGDRLCGLTSRCINMYVCPSARKYSDSYLVPKNLRIYNRVWQVISLPLATGARSKFEIKMTVHK